MELSYKVEEEEEDRSLRSTHRGARYSQRHLAPAPRNLIIGESTDRQQHGRPPKERVSPVLDQRRVGAARSRSGENAAVNYKYGL
mmetsp:Transcript_8699/g.26155  ORF Transcript_8699/g.26155 Transcript_8699/m.26155 type:complete len:85 (+) Transcript_8699:826-1080(+)